MELNSDDNLHAIKRFVVRGKAFDVSTPRVMGIVNTTPDSFSDGGRYTDKQKAMSHIRKMVDEGAYIIDVGGESTRPGSEPVPFEEEIQRTIPVLEDAIKEFPEIFFSIDTTKYKVAKKALEAGAHFINDVSGLQKSPEFTTLCNEFGAGLMIMHSQGEPKTMQQNPSYNDVVSEVIEFLDKAVKKAKDAGVSAIITDPGIGFGKTMEHNIALLRNLSSFQKLGYPVLLGVSRKSMIGKILNDRPVDGRLAGSIALQYDGLLQGADILRVHDVQEAFDSILMYNALHQ